VILLFPPIPMSARTFVFGFAALELFFGITGTAAGSPISLIWEACWAAGC